MNTHVTINSFTCQVDIPVQLKCRSTSLNGEKVWVLFNFDHGMCSFGQSRSYDGLNYQWENIGIYVIRESKDGLQYYDAHQFCCWKFFDDDTQQEYAGYKLEKAIQ